jgi:hypothetical protein
MDVGSQLGPYEIVGRIGAGERGREERNGLMWARIRETLGKGAPARVTSQRDEVQV